MDLQLKSGQTQKATTGFGSSRIDNRQISKLKSLESMLFDQAEQQNNAISISKKDVYIQILKRKQIKNLQNVVQDKLFQIKDVQKNIEQYKKEGDLQIDFVNDQIKEYTLLLARQRQTDPEKDQLAILNERKKKLKQETVQLHNINKVMQFELNVQQNLSLKLNANKLQIKKKIQMFDDYILKTESKIRQKQPNLDLNEMPQAKKKMKNQQQAIGIVQKTPEEILQEKNQLIEEYTKKIDQLTFQIQEITRTCILEKQELLKKIQDNKEDVITLADKILNLKLRINKIDKMEASLSSDKSNTRGLSKETEHSQQKQDPEEIEQQQLQLQ